MNEATQVVQAFHTNCTFKVYGFEKSKQLFKDLEEECLRYEKLFSHTLNESELVRVNNAAGTPVEVSPELADLVRTALHYCEATDGLFDISAGGLVDLWNSPETKQLLITGEEPSADSLNHALAHVNYQGIWVSKNTIQLEDPATKLVLGGIAKGYIADKLCAFMQDRGVEHGFVNLGGNVKVFGGKLNEEGEAVPYLVGLRVPRPSYAGEEAAFAAVQLESGAVVTSGIYERGVAAADGSFYHHILDPRTGAPAQTDLVSASLISEGALDGDGYTTALIIMGLERARAFVEALPGCEAVFVSQDNTIHVTSGMGSSVPFFV